MKKEEIHIGSLIKDFAKSNNYSDAEIARRINTSRQNIKNIYDSKSIDTQRLKDLCDALNHDFFKYYQIDKPQPTVDNFNTTSAKFVLQIELTGDEAIRMGLQKKVLEILNH